MIIQEYRKCCDISSIVHKTSFRDASLVPSVTESDIVRHLQAENILLCESFALEYQNYAHYGAFQHVNLRSLRKADEERFNELKEMGFGTSLTGYVFSGIHSDLVTEPFIKETKGTSGHFRRGFSTDIDSVNISVNTINIHTIPKVA